MPSVLWCTGMQGGGYRTIITINEDWTFLSMDGVETTADLPHTWNGRDGQDGGDDYRRETCRYRRIFDMPRFDAASQCVYLEFLGVNASADVTLNGRHIMHHDGGYATFRADITDALAARNTLEVAVDNGVNDRVYPQQADFTFYGGVYRDVRLLIVPKEHIDLDYHGGHGVRILPSVRGVDGVVNVRTWHSNAIDMHVEVRLVDADGLVVAQGHGDEVTLTIPDVRLWDGVDDPYRYTARVALVRDGCGETAAGDDRTGGDDARLHGRDAHMRERVGVKGDRDVDGGDHDHDSDPASSRGTIVDEVAIPFGVRTFRVDPRRGFILNGRPYPLHAVTRHQDRPGIGNALSDREHDQDMALIREMGANAIRLAHYQHDQYFYDLCDRYGIIVWAEIPYISRHMPAGRANTISQMTELIVQNHHHPSIITWGVSNEITIATRDRQDMLDNHHELNRLCHRLDPTRPTTLACYAMCSPFDKVAHITDLVGWNLYLGWYVPGLFLNDLWISLFHLLFPLRRLGYSEYGCEGMPNLHSSHPRRGDQTEEYQCRYHEFMLECFERHPYLWITCAWTMFDFASDARDQGGEPGMNHKGLVTFDRRTRKDAFYLYKAYWGTEPFVHLCGKRYVNRAERVTTVKVYSNLPQVRLYANGTLIGGNCGKVSTFRVPIHGETKLEAVSGDCRDSCTIRSVAKPDPDYRLDAGRNSARNWT